MCSLKEAGFAGRHRCGVTLLSGEMKYKVSFYILTDYSLKESDNDTLKTFRARNIRGCPCVCSTLQLHVQGSLIIRFLVVTLKYSCLGRGRQCG